MPGIGIIANPYSKLNRKNPDRPGYLSYIAGQKGHVAVTKSLDELKKVAFTFKKQDISILAINGGDGTISQTLSVFSQIYQDHKMPQIALLRGGTMNVLAGNIKIKGTPENLLYRLIERHSTENKLVSVNRQCLKIQDQIGYLFASGTPANFLEKFYENKSSAVGAAMLICKVVLWRFFNHKLYKKIVTTDKCEIKSNGVLKYKLDTISVLVSTLPKMPMGPMLFPEMQKEKNIDKAQLVAYSADPIKASYQIPIDAFLFPAKSSAIKFKLLSSGYSIVSNKPLSYTLDGELYYPKDKELQIKVGPKFDFILL